MRIVSEEWKPAGSNEAIVIVSDGEFTLAVFSHPYTRCIGDFLCDPLHLVDAKLVENSTSPIVSIQRQSGELKHKITAVLKDRKKGLFAVGDIILEMEDEIPADIAEGEVVDIVCNRIDLW